MTYALKAPGYETNIAWFGGVQRRKGVSAALWNRRRIFVRSFIVPRFGRAFIRTSKDRLPIRPVYGPNLARELVKDSSATAWQSGVAAAVIRVFLYKRSIVVGRSGAYLCGAIVLDRV